MTTNTLLSTPTTQPAGKRLHRSDDRILGGVCSGIAEYTGLDTTLVRILAVATMLFGGGGIVLYAVAWLVMPDTRGTVLAARRPKTDPPAADRPAADTVSEPAATPTGTTTSQE